ncbi:hypothetical protein D3C81_1445570 [compost metagenome]
MDVTTPAACPYDSPSRPNPTRMKIFWPVAPPPSSHGVTRLKTPISTAIVASVVRRPMRSASQPEISVPINAIKPPAICTASTSEMLCSWCSTAHDSGNTVTRWNNA